MAKPASEYQLTELYTAGYHDKLQRDEVPVGAAVRGSKNFFVDDDGKWTTRPGCEYFARATLLTTNTGTSTGRLVRRDGIEVPVVALTSTCLYYNGEVDNWAVLFESVTSSRLGFAAVDRSSDNTNRLAISGETDNYRLWSGVYGTVASVTGTTIVLSGSTTLADRGFTATGNVIVGSVYGSGQTFAYTGISGSTFTGVTPDPSAAGLVANDPLAQKPVEYASNPKGDVLLATANARVLVGHVRPSAPFAGGGQVYGSKSGDPTDFSFTTPRTAADGFIVNVPEGGYTITGMAQFEDGHFMFKNSSIQKLTFSTDGNDIIQLQPLSSYDERTTSDDGSVSARAVFRLGNAIFFVSPTKVINTVSRVEQKDYPQVQPISDPIKSTTEEYHFDETTCGISWRGRCFFACKSSADATSNDRILIYNNRYGCWDTPMEGVGVIGFFIFESALYGVLVGTQNTVKIWSGTTDYKSTTVIGNPINAELRLRRENLGLKADRKDADTYYIEGEMEESGTADIEIVYDENEDTRGGTLAGSEGDFFFTPSGGGAFGEDEFGVETFGPSDPESSPSNARRFRLYFRSLERPFYNIQLRIRTSSYFKLIANGPAAHVSESVLPASLSKALT